MSDELVVQSEVVPAVQRERTVDDVVEMVAKVQDLMRRSMRQGEHYGVIPGTSGKPTLLQAGAQKLAFVFELIPKYEIIRRDLGDGHVAYDVTCSLHHMPTEQFRGQGVGSCSTMEKKYRYRQERAATPTGEPIPNDYKQRKAEYARQGYGCRKVDGQWAWCKLAEGEQIENKDVADQWNTVLKMAKKRAYVDAVLTSTAASDVFTQDIGDPEPVGEVSRSPSHSTPPPAPDTYTLVRQAIDKTTDANALGGFLGPIATRCEEGKLTNDQAAELHIRCLIRMGETAKAQGCLDRSKLPEPLRADLQDMIGHGEEATEAQAKEAF